MRTLRFLLKKEFRQIFRNPTLLKMILIMPVIQLLVLPLAADYEIKNIHISIVDHDRSSLSRDLRNDVVSSGYFILNDYGNSFPEAYQRFQENASDLILEIPKDFEKDLVNQQGGTLFIAVNAINGTKASIGNAYLGQIVRSFNSQIRLQNLPKEQVPQLQQIAIAPQNWYNPHLEYTFYMVPGILALLVTMISAYMCALNIVKEREVGTIEQINVTPIKKHHFILGKLIPFWIMGVLVFSLGLFGIARLIYHIVPLGSVLTLYAFLALYLVALLGVGLLISTYSSTQQQAMSLAFFVMMIFILMSGLFTPVDSMPYWAKTLAHFNPVTYFIEVLRMVILKGSGLADIKWHFLVIFIMALFFNSWAILNYKKTS